jgi:type IV secretion system protein VirB10
VLAAGLMITLGAAALSWYYANALTRQKRARQAAQTASTSSAQGEMTLPSLGRIESPHMPSAVEAGADSGESTHGAPGRLSTGGGFLPAAASALPLEEARSNWNPTSVSPTPYATPQQYGAPQREGPTDRRLSGPAFARDSALPATPTTVSDAPETDATALPANGAALNELANTRDGGLTALLRPGAMPAARAQTLPTQRLLLPKGAFIDCTLETAIDSTLPGMTTCVTATDTFGADGKVVLLERGSKLVGETRGEVQNGAARVFVVWTEARSPTGVLVPLDSPGTDELGRSGLPGQVNRHFWDRFGAAILISVLDGAMQAAVQSSSRGGGTVIFSPSASQNVLTDVLKGTINTAPTVVKHQGDRIQILVARDLDFRPVYELRSVAAGR